MIPCNTLVCLLTGPAPDPEGEKASPEGAEASTGNVEEEEEEDEEEESVPGCTLFIKNLNFSTTEETLKEVSETGDGEGTPQAVA